MAAEPISNRREFLQGRAAADALGAALERVARSAEERPTGAVSSPREPDRYVVQLSRPAMACQFAIFLNAGQYEQGSEAALAALDLIEQLEQQLTIYRDSSEVMRVNRTADQEEVPLEAGLYVLLAKAAEISRETQGAFDVTAGPLVKAWGFSKRAGAVPTEDELRAALARVGSQHLEFDEQRQTIRFRQPGIEINLGAIGKGYALDRAAVTLEAAGVDDFLIHGGQSSVLARGAHGGDADSGWIVGVGDPLRPERRLAEITLRNQALATSGASHQFFRHQGKRYGHILDPRTGWPAEGVFSSTVVAPTAAEADALSTAFYTLGIEAATDYCRQHPQVGMILLYPGKGASAVEFATAGLDTASVRWLT